MNRVNSIYTHSRTSIFKSYKDCLTWLPLTFSVQLSNTTQYCTHGWHMLAMGRHKHANYSSQPTLLLKTQQCINTHRNGFDNGIIVRVTLWKTPKQELGVCVIQHSYVFHCQEHCSTSKYSQYTCIYQKDYIQGDMTY